MTKIKGSRIVITGAGSGIGEATALRAAKAGASEVVCVGINFASAQETAAACEGLGATATAWHCDVADRASVQQLADAIESECGTVDVLVNNAGVGLGGPFLQASVEDWDWLIGINLNGVAYGCHAFGAAMVKRGAGHVVNIASGAAYLMSRDMAAYCASKAGVVALSRCLRADWASSGVGVSVICPGVINTPIAAATRMVGELADRQDKVVSAFRYGHSPEIVAKAILKATEHNTELQPVGFESELAYRLLPLVPGPIRGALTRAPLHKLT
jgi:2-hydroxycyclohexanecarboxyl-CoA dehydrogenase